MKHSQISIAIFTACIIFSISSFSPALAASQGERVKFSSAKDKGGAEIALLDKLREAQKKIDVKTDDATRWWLTATGAPSGCVSYLMSSWKSRPHESPEKSYPVWWWTYDEGRYAKYNTQFLDGLRPLLKSQECVGVDENKQIAKMKEWVSFGDSGFTSVLFKQYADWSKESKAREYQRYWDEYYQGICQQYADSFKNSIKKIIGNMFPSANSALDNLHLAFIFMPLTYSDKWKSGTGKDIIKNYLYGPAKNDFFQLFNSEVEQQKVNDPEHKAAYDFLLQKSPEIRDQIGSFDDVKEFFKKYGS